MALQHIAFCAALMLGASGALAQQAGDGAATSGKDSRVADCVRTQRHDHGAERGFPATKAPCKPVKSASAKTKAKVDGHDHGKMHKNQ